GPAAAAAARVRLRDRPGRASPLPPRGRRVGHDVRDRDHLRRHRLRPRRRDAARAAAGADPARGRRADRVRDADGGRPGPHARCMTLEEELETAVTAAGRHARPGEQPVAVMAAEPAGTRVFVVALAAGDELGFVAVDGAGTAVADRRLVKDAVSLAALAERAEEVSGATAADDLVEQFRGAVGGGGGGGGGGRSRRGGGRSRRPPGRGRRRPAGGDARVSRPAGRARRRAGGGDRGLRRAGGAARPGRRAGLAGRRGGVDGAGRGGPGRRAGQLRPGDDRGLGGCRRARRRRAGQLPGGARGVKAFDRLIAASLPAVPRVVVRRIADRYIAGETLDDAVATVRELNRLGAMATVDVLGEFISRPEEAEETATEYER